VPSAPQGLAQAPSVPINVLEFPSADGAGPSRAATILSTATGIAGGAAAGLTGVGAIAAAAPLPKEVTKLAGKARDLGEKVAKAEKALEFITTDLPNLLEKLVKPPIPQVQFTFEADGQTGWKVRSVEIEEAVGEPYRCIVELRNEHAGADPDALEGASCRLGIERGSAVRHVCGIIRRVWARGTMQDAHLAQVEVVPALALLAQTRDSRILDQEASVDAILRQVLSDALSPYNRKVRLDLERTYQPREYCTQYDESDLDFAHRLMSEEGIFYYFDHSGDAEELVLVDKNQKCPDYRTPEGEPVPVVSPEASHGQIHCETISRFEHSRMLTTTGASVRDYDWTRPELSLHQPESAVAADAKGRKREHYEYTPRQVVAKYDQGSKRYTTDEPTVRVRLRNEELQRESVTIQGGGNVSGLAPGHILEISGHAKGDFDGKYLVTSVKHAGGAPEEVIHEMKDVPHGVKERYWNHFTCVPLKLPYRPALLRRPVIAGPQTATVVGPAGEEIFTDEHGRIKVQFHWDRKGKKDDHSSCWVRVAQIWGGAGWGFVFLPRIGMEVVVQFLEGNPDRPLVTGCVYNGVHPPPYELPAKKTVSTIKTSSSPGNNGSNELRFEDAAKSEEIYLHAQKDLNEVVENDHTTTVHANQTNTVDKNRTKSVGGDESNTISGNRTSTVKKDDTHTVEKTRTTTITGKETQTFKDSRGVTVHVDDSLTVETGTRTVEVKGKLTETYHGGRGATVENGDSLEVKGSNKDDTIHGEYNITADTHFQVKQASDKLLIENQVSIDSVGDISLKNGGVQFTAGKDGKLSINAGSEVSITCGASSLTMKQDGTIELTGVKVKVGNANNNASFEPPGTTVSGVKVSVTAVGIHEIQGAVIKIG
jgi:type VI secretion system secreted protein VgrG